MVLNIEKRTKFKFLNKINQNAQVLFLFLKIPRGEHSVEDIPNFACMCVFSFVNVRPPGQTKNDTDLKFGIDTPIDFVVGIGVQVMLSVCCDHGANKTWRI